MIFMTPAPVDQLEKVNNEMPTQESDSTGSHQQEQALKDQQPAEDSAFTKFTWKIENFSKIQTTCYSDVFLAGGFKWRMHIFFDGRLSNSFYVFLDAADSSDLPYGWSRHAEFILKVIDQINPVFSKKIDSEHRFNAIQSSWGFTSFMSLSELHDPVRGYLDNDTLVIEAEVFVRKVDQRISKKKVDQRISKEKVDQRISKEKVDQRMRDSQKKTAYVGLKNQGATCYMNSLLQTLYHIPYFRKAVYHMPTTEDDLPSASIPLALQNLFHKLQYSGSSVETQELTQSFGWNVNDLFMQHDVQELNRVLCEKLEGKMKETVVEGTIQRLFEGHLMSYIECINVDYKSTRKESFYDLQLDVKGCRDVYASFDKYVEAERLEGQNKYQAEQYGLQDARKGSLFVDFPPVLQLQLKRFEFVYTSRTLLKINDRYEFPLQLDLDRENRKYLSPDANTSVRNLYELHSVLVHSGGVHGGHYYAFIRPTLSNKWYKFDDELVTQVDIDSALEGQYGGEEDFNYAKTSNAYMLVYIRESDKDEIICNVDENDIAMHLRKRLKKEQKEEKEEENKMIKKDEAQLYNIIKVARDEDLAHQIGRDIYFDLVDLDKVRMFRVQKYRSFRSFKEEVAKEFGVLPHLQRFWFWEWRPNNTYRLFRPLTLEEENHSINDLRGASGERTAELNLFLEVERGPDLIPVALPSKSWENRILFFKLYDPQREELRYAGRLFVKDGDIALGILTKLNEMAGYAADEEIGLYEEIGFHPTIVCDMIDKENTFKDNLFADGDIVCYQKTLSAECQERLHNPDVPTFLEYIQNRQVVHFRSLGNPSKDDFCLELTKLDSYDEVVERMAELIGLDDPSKICLTSHNRFTRHPQSHPIKFRGVNNLTDMLSHCNKISDILYYEVLDLPLPVFGDFRILTIMFHHAATGVSLHRVKVQKEGTVSDVIKNLKTEVKLSCPAAEIRLLVVFRHRIRQVLSLDENIEFINETRTLRAEEIPEEEKNLDPNSRLIHVYHFIREPFLDRMRIRNFSDPFLFVIHEDETLAEIKVRIQRKLQVPDEEFAKWRFAFVSFGIAEFLEDSDIVFKHFQRQESCDPSGRYLGLEHPNPPFEGVPPATRVHSSSIKIYN